MTFVKRFLHAIPALWDGIVDAMTGVVDTVAFVFRVTSERITGFLGPYVIPLFYLALVLLLWMVFNGR